VVHDNGVVIFWLCAVSDYRGLHKVRGIDAEKKEIGRG